MVVGSETGVWCRRAETETENENEKRGGWVQERDNSSQRQSAVIGSTIYASSRALLRTAVAVKVLPYKV